MATIPGTNLPDVLLGTIDPDVIDGLLADDLIYGFHGRANATGSEFRFRLNQTRFKRF